MRALKPSALLLCVVASLSAHALLLCGAWESGPRNWAPMARPLAVRVLPPGAAPANAEQEGARASLPEPLAVDPLPAGRQLAPIASADLPSLAGVPRLAAVDVGDDNGYIPRPKLTLPPVMREQVLLQWPADALPDGHYRGIVALYIDELGVVQRVRVDSPELPEALQEQARQAFIGVRFLPGQLQGREVKSLIRIEVTFDAVPQAQSKGLR